jgi:hypothetical protein
MKSLTSLILSLTFALTAFAQIPSNVPLQDLTVWYGFSGNTNNQNGTTDNLININNGATLTTDRFGMPNKAYYFDGVNDYMENAIPSFQFGEDSSFTISFWISKNNTTNGGWVYHYGLNQNQGGTNNFCQFFSANANAESNWRTNKQGQPWINLYSTYTANTWEHFAVTFENKTMTMYKNGAQYGTSITYTYTGALTATMPFRIGVSFTLTHSLFGGKIDDFGIWSRKLTSNEISNLYNPCTIVYGPAATITACGSYNSQSGTNYTTTGQYSDTLQTSTSCDSVITLNLTINNYSTATITAVNCSNYTSPSGLYTWTSSGTYYDTIPNTVGCDSIITVNLTINTVNVMVYTSADTLTAAASGATYQWLNCDNNNYPIAGATSQSFQGLTNGNYAVQITLNGCVDTSICYQLGNVGIEIIENSSAFNIYPNPNNGSFIITSDIKSDQFNIEVFNIEGKLVVSKTIGGKEINQQAISISKLNNGVYYIKLNNANKTYTQKLIIQK